jgi:topoisomerase-4 subunit B
VRFGLIRRFSARARFDPRRVFKMSRSKAYLFGGVEIRWKCDARLISEGMQRSRDGDLPLSRRAQGYLTREIEGKDLAADGMFAGKLDKTGPWRLRMGRHLVPV